VPEPAQVDDNKIIIYHKLIHIYIVVHIIKQLFHFRSTTSQLCSRVDRNQDRFNQKTDTHTLVLVNE
jgi:hypothetical protein